MKKSLLLIVSVFLMLFFTSSYSTKVVRATTGNIAPNFEVKNNDTTISLNKMRGKYVLLTFWSSADAESRISNIKNEVEAQKFSKQLAVVGVNYDRNEIIFNEIIKRDKLQNGTQFYDQDGDQSRIYGDYHLDHGYKSYLIDPAGEIIAENPSTSQLATMISQ
ncbi:MAG: redoxin domain-containing protein [Muribaculaceae bacterium]|nr:redoxin domain-containing protein [Muribaculaceae bacterium]